MQQEHLERDGPAEETRGEGVAGAEQFREARRRIASAYDRTRGAASRWYEGAVEYGRQNPTTSVLLAFGVGLGLGALLFQDRAPRYRRRVLPAIATALADVVRDVFEER